MLSCFPSKLILFSIYCFSLSPFLLHPLSLSDSPPFFSSFFCHFFVSLYILPFLPPVLLYVIGVITFPAGWDAEGVRQLCGDGAAKYNPGDCQIGWAYILIIAGTAVGLAAASLSFSAGLKRRKIQEPSYAI